MDAFNNADMEWSVYQQKPNTVDEALQFAMEYESFQKRRNRRVGERMYPMYQSTLTPHESVIDAQYPHHNHYEAETVYPNHHQRKYIGQQRQFKVKLGRSKYGHQSNTRVKMCWFCNTPGHMKRQCRKYKAWIQVHPSPSAAKPEVETPTAQDAAEQTEEVQVRTRGPSCDVPHNSLFLNVESLSIKLSCLVDTGGTVSVIHTDKYKEIPEHIRPQLQEANGDLVMGDMAVP
jgi:hypothetical protein